jgi:hypothetical protein
MVLKEVVWCLVNERTVSCHRIAWAFCLDDEGLEALRFRSVQVRRLGVHRTGSILPTAAERQAVSEAPLRTDGQAAEDDAAGWRAT